MKIPTVHDPRSRANNFPLERDFQSKIAVGKHPQETQKNAVY